MLPVVQHATTAIKQLKFNKVKRGGGVAFQYLCLFIADVLSSHRNRRFHSHKGKDLYQMVLHYISNNTELCLVFES